jgi:DNA-binding transcriptional LysR family regulator
MHGLAAGPAGSIGFVAKPGDLDWNDLRYFLSAARAQTLAGAARALSVEHSTVSRRLTALEEALGVPLFTRNPDGLLLTTAGEQVLRQVEEMARAADAVRDAATSARARVRLATPSGFTRVLSPHLAAFNAAYPGVTLDIVSGSRSVDLKRGEADLAIRQAAPTDDDLVSRKLADLPWSMYASDLYLQRRTAPVDPRALAGHDVVGFDSTLAGVPGAQWIAAHGAGAQIVMRCRELSDLLVACVAGLGLAVAPCITADLEPSLRRVTPEVLGSTRLALVYRKEMLVAAPVKAVIQFVSDVIR